MTIQDRTKEMYRFARPIIWHNDHPEMPYSEVGGTANIVKLIDEYFILTANHCMDKESDGWQTSNCRIPWKYAEMPNGMVFCKIGNGVTFEVKDDEGILDGVHVDIRIHRLDGPTDSDASPLEEGEYLELKPYIEPKPLEQILLTGFAKSEQEIDNESHTIKSMSDTIDGRVEATKDAFIHKFISLHLKGLDANGMSGGLITSNFRGNILMQGLCIQGGRNKNIDFVLFLDGEHVHHLVRKAYATLIQNKKS